MSEAVTQRNLLEVRFESSEVREEEEDILGRKNTHRGL